MGLQVDGPSGLNSSSLYDTRAYLDSLLPTNMHLQTFLDGSGLSLLSVVLSGALLVFTVTYFMARPDRLEEIDPTTGARRPPLVRPYVPVIGHVLGFLKYATGYLPHLGRQNFNLPIFRISIFGSQFYVVTGRSVARSVHRSGRSLSLWPLVPKFVGRVLGMSAEGLRIMVEKDLMAEMMEGLHLYSIPGEAIDAAKLLMVQSVEQTLQRLSKSCGCGTADGSEVGLEIDLYQWTRRTIAAASTKAIYGPNNPFEDPARLADVLTFEKGCLPLLPNFMPAWLAPKAYQARENCVAAFVESIAKEEAGDVPQASRMIQDHNRILAEAGLSRDDVARHGLGYSFGVLSNSISAAFWMLYHIYSDPELLTKVRTELDPLVPQSTLNLADLASSAPLLNAVFHEVMRMRNNHSLTRFVQDDVTLNDVSSSQSWSIEAGKGNLLFICQAVMHRDESVWGVDANDFQGDRFLPFTDANEKENPGSFLGFGAGGHVCPGRHFAVTEVLTFVAALVVWFDISPKMAKDGQWIEPTREPGTLFTSVLPPNQKIPVAVRKRPGRQGDLRIIADPVSARIKIVSG